jgi:hypothetical protein
MGRDRIILKWIFKKKDMRVFTGFFWLWIETSGCNEPSTSVKDVISLNELNDC